MAEFHRPDGTAIWLDTERVATIEPSHHEGCTEIRMAAFGGHDWIEVVTETPAAVAAAVNCEEQSNGATTGFRPSPQAPQVASPMCQMIHAPLSRDGSSRTTASTAKEIPTSGPQESPGPTAPSATSGSTSPHRPTSTSTALPVSLTPRVP